MSKVLSGLVKLKCLIKNGTTCVILISQDQNNIFQQRDKLLPVFKHGFLTSEENVNLNSLYTHGSVSVNIYLINFDLMADVMPCLG